MNINRPEIVSRLSFKEFLRTKIPINIVQLSQNEPRKWEQLSHNELRKWDFIYQNRDLPLVSSKGVRIQIEEVPASGPVIGNPVTVEISVKIEPTTTLDQVSEAWPVISAWRDRLRDFRPQIGRILIDYLRYVKDYGHSYGEIAQALNEQIEENIRKGYAKLEEARAHPLEEQIKKKISEKNAYLREAKWRPGDGGRINCADGIMTLMGFKLDEKFQWISSAIENMEAGRPLFPPKSPINYQLVRERLRNPPKIIRDPKYVEPEQTLEWVVILWEESPPIPR